MALTPNLMRRPYRGGSALAAFRHSSAEPDSHCPEDWIASTTTVFGEATLGLSTLPDGQLLRDAIARDPESYLGPEHVATYGTDSGMLLKLIDAQQRLSVHVHPSRDFARDQLGTPYGKNEAWYVLHPTREDPSVYLGFRDDIEPEYLLETVEAGRGDTLLDQMNELRVQPGDCIFVPSGTAHAIGEGIFLAEVQEPSDLLVRLEWNGYAVGAMPNDLGLGFAKALTAVDCRGWRAGDLDAVRTTADPAVTNEFRSALPEMADTYFRLEQASIRGDLEVTSGYSVLVVTQGTGSVRGRFGDVALTTGMTVLLPHAAGEVTLAGDLDVLRALPAAPATVHKFDPGLARLLGSQHDSAPGEPARTERTP